MTNFAMRCAASTVSSVLATSAMPQKILAGIHALCGPRQIAARQHGHIIVAIQGLREGGVGERFAQPRSRQVGPKIKTGIRHRDLQYRLEYLDHLGELLRVHPAIFRNVRFVVPCGDAGSLYRRIHRRAVVGAVQREFLDDPGVARDKAGAHARHVGSLRQAGEHHQIPVIAAAQVPGGLQRAQRPFGKIDLGIAFIRSDHESVAVGHLEQRFPFRQRHHPPGRIARRAHVDQLAALPDIFGQLREVHRVVVLPAGC